MSKKAIMERLKKLMALSRSSNVHEAAAAMERATPLMQEHQITEDDLVLSNVTECNTSFAWGAKVNPAQYQTWLWSMIQDVFGVECVFNTHSGHVTFYGLSGRAEMAAYTCDVLSRQLRTRPGRLSQVPEQTPQTANKDQPCRQLCRRLDRGRTKQSAKHGGLAG
ncbi:DUF2786 domain-containing protein [Acetobacter syzygii]|uniref:DUF2786 domain-containing protein n=1 Tax=Acetobacter syzygii TaxID=146476 RepID=UPI0039EC1F28